MELSAQFLHELALVVFIIIMVIVIIAAFIWKKFKEFLIDELNSSLITPIESKVSNLQESHDKDIQAVRERQLKIEERFERFEARQAENQREVQSKFESILLSISGLTGKFDGLSQKLDFFINHGRETKE